MSRTLSEQAQPGMRRRKGSNEKDIQESPGKDTSPKSAHNAKEYVCGSIYSITDKLCLLMVTLLSLVVRFYKLHLPHEVVFDEVHFGKFASYYLRHTYFFDVHPPLGKLLFAAVGFFIGYDGAFDYKEIGLDYYENKVPFVYFRGLSALFGALTVPVMYAIMKESFYHTPVCVLVACMAALENGLITQSRFILLDSSLLFFQVLGMYCWIRFFKLRKRFDGFNFLNNGKKLNSGPRAFTEDWWKWLVLTGVSMTLNIGVKMVGLFLFLTIGTCVLIRMWYLLDVRRGLSMKTIGKHFFSKAFGLLLVPALVYLSFFYVHFLVLYKTGTGDDSMSPEFQRTLEGNPMTKESHRIAFGMNITLKHVGNSNYLHSHLSRYPLRYEDDRVSSQGQQVTGYPHRDINNIWQIKPATIEAHLSYNPDTKHPHYLSDGDEVILEHVNSKSNLLTHDVASPLTTTNMEMTTIPVNDTARFNQTIWTIHLKKGKNWRSHVSYLRIVSKVHNVAIFCMNSPLPEWGFKQMEINGNKKTKDDSNLWVVDDIVGFEELWKKYEKDEDKNQLDNLKPMSFISKFFEAQLKMISKNSKLTSTHPYQSQPMDWPLLVRGISFWQSKVDKGQVYLIGNPIIWWTGSLSLAAFLGCLFAVELWKRRGINLVDEEMRTHLWRSGGFFLLAYSFHYFPFFLFARQLFLHHYFPCLLISFMVAGAFFQFIMYDHKDIHSAGKPFSRNPSDFSNKTIWMVVVVIICLYGMSFMYFSPFVYGDSLTLDQINQHKWLSGWDFQWGALE